MVAKLPDALDTTFGPCCTATPPHEFPAAEKVEIRDGATVEGDVVSPQIAIGEGAQFHGSVDMSQRARSAPRTTPPQRPPCHRKCPDVRHGAASGGSASAP
jgi:hypothetical protein